MVANHLESFNNHTKPQNQIEQNIINQTLKNPQTSIIFHKNSNLISVS